MLPRYKHLSHIVDNISMAKYFSTDGELSHDFSYRKHCGNNGYCMHKESNFNLKIRRSKISCRNSDLNLRNLYYMARNTNLPTYQLRITFERIAIDKAGLSPMPSGTNICDKSRQRTFKMRGRNRGKRKEFHQWIDSALGAKSQPRFVRFWASIKFEPLRCIHNQMVWWNKSAETSSGICQRLFLNIRSNRIIIYP